MLSFIMAHLFVPEPLDLYHVVFLALFLVLCVQLLFDTLDKGVEEAEKHDEEAKVSKMRFAVSTYKYVLEKHPYLHFYLLIKK